MIVHIALFRWKEGTKQDHIDRLLETVKRLKTKCNGIVNILVGQNYHKESKGFTHGVVVLAKDQEALDNYRKHPDHKIVAKEIEKVEEDGLGFDFEDSGSKNQV